MIKLKRASDFFYLAIGLTGGVILWFVDFGKFSYLTSDFLIAGSIILYMMLRDVRALRKHVAIFAVLVVLAIVITLIGETVALEWRIWTYNPERTLGIVFGPALETVLFAIFVFIAVATSTLRYSVLEDKKRKKRKS